MKNRRAPGWVVVFASIAAYALVVQMVLGSILLGSAVAAPVVDDFGNPLCITRAGGSSQSDHKDGPKLPECCTQACSVLAPVLAPQFSDNFLNNRLEATSTPVPAETDTGPFERPETSPGNPRAPPPAA
ncbi:hypothetical protein [Neorhizobium galegae]|uniref:hypothetical protein n=1 Tax=Neorhizobium galegae TaxID=399 RepID=UPI0006228BC7|nr:hypothetical protein [Neorhizobium galegae]CDZ29631.1 Hypothetical protein NGAL_HAMBI490_44980 [Neorhizobium galegae bv. officinalis]KAA9388653.1 hypothetical protein F4V88_20440 [Neorhizobium galegae]KAB1113954.1 hypothetical protein F4V89_09905 [Neorhizobium galegae]MCM2501054.1 hypothetical protein [Neorhizobium galegae]MCQ1770947.1 hypothetical protein [Neorhizobium galegae]